MKSKTKKPTKAVKSSGLSVTVGSDSSPTLEQVVKAAHEAGARVTCSLVPKPPIGLRPRWIAEEMRMKEIASAMLRYNEAGKPVPAPWTEELAELVCNDERRRAWIHRDTFNPNGPGQGRAQNGESFHEHTHKKPC